MVKLEKINKEKGTSTKEWIHFLRASIALKNKVSIWLTSKHSVKSEKHYAKQVKISDLMRYLQTLWFGFTAISKC